MYLAIFGMMLIGLSIGLMIYLIHCYEYPPW